MHEVKFDGYRLQLHKVDVSKKSDQPYVSGKNRGWIKVKCHAWREANRGRGELFNKGKRA